MRETLAARLRIALGNLIVDEFSLFVPWVAGRPASEMTVCAQLARYLAPLFPRTWDIDCHYNRAGVTKAKRGVGGGLHPADLIIHRRTGRGARHNLLVVELKVTQASEGRGGSEQTLSELMLEHAYQYGVFLQLNCTASGGISSLNPKWKWLRFQQASEAGVVFDKPALDSLLIEGRRNWESRKNNFDTDARQTRR